jgi:outer membrane receptor for ferrienterochelin and colicins
VTLQKRISVFNKFSLLRTQNRVATIAGRFIFEDRWGGEMQWNKSFRGGDSIYGESIYTRRWEVIGNYQLPVMEPIYFSFSATNHNQDSYYGVTPYMGKQSILFGQMKWDKKLGAEHDLVLGAAARYTYYDDNSTATIDTLTQTNQPQKTWLPGVFLQDEWRLNEKHLLLFGLRWDYHPLHKNIFTPRLAYKWSISDQQTFRINAGTGFRVVNLFTEDHAALTGARAVEIKEALKPEQSYNININYLRNFGTASKRFSIDASAWYTYFHNQIIADYDVHPNKIVYQNLDGYALSKGFSLNLEMNLMQRFKGMAGITLQDVAITEADDNGKHVKRRQPFTERWSGTWALSYTFPIQGLTIDYTGNVYGPMRLPLLSDSLDPRRPESPVWSIQNIQLTKWISKELELYGGVKNLLNWTPARNNPFLIARANDPFDKHVRYNADGSVMRVEDPSAGKAYNPYGLTFDPTYIYAPNQGIRFFLGIRWNIR